LTVLNHSATLAEVGRNFWRLLVSSAASNLADGVFFIALPLLAVGLTDSPILIAGVAIAGRLPWLVFVLIAGALADRLDRRITMRNVQLLRVVVVGAMAALAVAGQLSLPVLYVAAFVLGVGETLFDTAAQSMLPSIVDKEELPRANGRLYAVELTMNQFIGPPLGGLLIAVSVPLALGGAVVGYAIAAVGLALITGVFRPERTGPRTNLVTDIAEGLRYLLRHRLLRTLALMVGVMNFSFSAVFAVFVLYAVAPGPLGLDEAGFGLLTTTLAIGSVLGSLVVARVETRLGPANVLSLSVLTIAITTIVPAFTTSAWVVGAMFVLGGVANVSWNVITVSLRQRIVPNELLGRVNAGYRLFAWGTQPLGALAGGIVAATAGINAVFILGGLLSASLLLTRSIVTDAAIAEADHAPTGAVVPA
jgi:MFS family permease